MLADVGLRTGVGEIGQPLCTKQEVCIPPFLTCLPMDGHALDPSLPRCQFRCCANGSCMSASLRILPSLAAGEFVFLAQLSGRSPKLSFVHRQLLATSPFSRHPHVKLLFTRPQLPPESHMTPFSMSATSPFSRHPPVPLLDGVHPTGETVCQNFGLILLAPKTPSKGAPSLYKA